MFLCLRFSYYTAGTGGAGPTILATSFLLLGEKVVAYSKGLFQMHSCITTTFSLVQLLTDHHSDRKYELLFSGEKIKLKPYSGMLNIDFGKGIGKRDVYLL